MLTVGQGLYNLTQRDLSTLFVDSFFREVGSTIAAGTDAGEVVLQIPVDRCLWLGHVHFQGSAAALSTWTSIAMTLTSTSGTFYRVFRMESGSAGVLGDNSTASGAGGVCSVNRSFNLLLPPNTQSIRFAMARIGSTNPATWVANCSGYLIPPGGIGRLA